MFKDKHLIIAMANNIFTSLYIDMLINNVGVNAGDLAFVSLDNGDVTALSSKYKVLSGYVRDFSVGDFAQAKTITFISLYKSNSFLVRELLDYQLELIDKIYVYLTEDELDRWVATKVKYGKLVVTKRNFVESSCIEVLPKLKNFIVAESFSDELEYVLEHNNFNIINARDAFSVLPVKLLARFEALYEDQSPNTLPEKKVLIGAKRHVFTLSEVLSFLRAMEKVGALLDYKYMIFTYKKRKFFRILIDFYCLYLRHIKRKNIDISYPTTSNSVTYLALVASCSDLILQRRGSMTTVREYLKMGRGVIHVKEGTRNLNELTKTIGVDVAKYSTFEELAKNIKENNIDIQKNKKIAQQYFKNCYELLGKIYL